MKKGFYIGLIFCLFLFTGCKLSGLTPYGPLGAESGDQNIKIYADSDIDITPGKITIDDTTVFYLRSSDTVEDMDKIKHLFNSRYEVYERFFM